ncbi:uncharacterized protein BJ171DRAFT_493651, partial [Polychytrium aggregatum]|uniref:uncharacterized protein n=1 Tax=Polychytrium aggregatum TaxID=110093 RepID=UPI0022FDD42C
KAINDSTIHRWILEQVSKSEVVGVVMFVTQDDVLNSRLSREVIALMEIMTTRFVGYESMCFYAISGRSMPGDMHEFIRMSLGVVASGKLRVMGLSSDNWARCKNKDFSRVKSWCLQRLQSPEPRLVPRVTTDTCKRCGIKADPLIEISQCQYHGSSGSLIHGNKTHKKHRLPVSNAHFGTWRTDPTNMCRGPWSCCGSRKKESPCRYMTYPCCRQASDDAGCLEICNNCERQVTTEGCQGSCRNCEKPMVHQGCQREPSHSWKGEIVPFKINIEESQDLPVIDEEDFERFYDDYGETEGADMYAHATFMFGEFARKVVSGFSSRR